jgi:acyl-CoA thioester hydrolase
MRDFGDLLLVHSTEIRTRYADTDKMGVVYNGNYFAFFEVGRTELMRKFGLKYTELEASGYFLPLIESHANYLNPAFYDDILRIEAILKPDYSPILRFDYNIFRDNTTIAKGFTVHSFMNSETRKATRPPKIYWELLEKLLNEK